MSTRELTRTTVGTSTEHFGWTADDLFGLPDILERPAMQRKLSMHLSPRCGAHCRTTGRPCQNAAMANGRCHLHGGKSTGPPRNNRNNFRHGR
jgi:hypothetical protein